MQDAKSLIGVVVIVLVLLFGAAYYFSSTEDNGSTVTPAGDDANSGLEQSIVAQHQYKSGTHTVLGEVEVPTPCHELTNEIIVRESYPEQVTIALSVEADDSDACVQVITTMQFKVSFGAAENALITATLNGESVILNLLKIDEDEEFEDFGEVFKG